VWVINYDLLLLVERNAIGNSDEFRNAYLELQECTTSVNSTSVVINPMQFENERNILRRRRGTFLGVSNKRF
jgi:hypothetical protein